VEVHLQVHVAQLGQPADALQGPEAAAPEAEGPEAGAAGQGGQAAAGEVTQGHGGHLEERAEVK